MWIELKKDIFEKSDKKGLNYIFQILSWYPSNSSRRYKYFVDIDRVSTKDNFIFLNTVENDLVNILNVNFDEFVNSSLDATQPDYEITLKKGSNRFNIEESIHFFSQPVSIILENSKNDSLFFEAIINHFGNSENGNITKNHLNNNWIRFENAGGCSNIPNFLTKFLDQFRHLADKNNRDPSDYFRGIIFIDSDLDYLGQPSKQDSLIEKLSQIIDLKYVYILQKRAMENYLPNEVFEDLIKQPVIRTHDYGKLKNWIEAYLSLTDEQKNFINIPSGFPPKDNKITNQGTRKAVSEEILNFFKLQMTDINFQKLDCGFKFNGFDNNGNLLKNENFKNAFPSLFSKPIVNKENLSSRDGCEELTKILNKIKELI